MKCPICGEEKIVVKEAVTGFPNYHVEGSKKEYCGYCDKPPVIELIVAKGKIVLVPDE